MRTLGLVGLIALVTVFSSTAVSAPRRRLRRRIKRPRRVLPADAGPTRVRLSNYPKAIRRLAPLYRRMCSRCHTIARPNNTTMAPDMWDFYLKVGMRRPRTRITNKVFEKLVRFIIFDQKHRKDPNPETFFPAQLILRTEDGFKVKDEVSLE